MPVAGLRRDETAAATTSDGVYRNDSSDNRGDSTDSRVFGPVPISSIDGQARVRVWKPGIVWAR